MEKNIYIYECLPRCYLLLCHNDSHKPLGNKHVTFSQTDCHGSRGTVEVNLQGTLMCNNGSLEFDATVKCPLVLQQEAAFPVV